MTKDAVPLTQASYRQLLTGLFERGYEFRRFAAAESALAEQRPFVLMRHDVDFELEAAVMMAELEAELGVSSTYFLLLRTEAYNVFSAAGSRLVRRLVELGHEIALHFDCAAYPGSDSVALAEHCRSECGLLETWFGCDIEVISLHRPSPIAIENAAEIAAPRRNTYEPLFTGPMTYYSDSRGIWRHGWPLDSEAFSQGRPLHLLAHPLWWTPEAKSNFEVLVDMIARRHERFQRVVAENCTVYRVGRFADVEDNS